MAVGMNIIEVLTKNYRIRYADKDPIDIKINNIIGIAILGLVYVHNVVISLNIKQICIILRVTFLSLDGMVGRNYAQNVIDAYIMQSTNSLHSLLTIS
jgi:hypothetical protein